ncbi:MAG: hypothetical protein LBL07_06890 [Tannerella sp.]|jgi:hypothetical protein|nr:hypothetical protein [Tannerella sp.]
MDGHTFELQIKKYEERAGKISDISDAFAKLKATYDRGELGKHAYRKQLGRLIETGNNKFPVFDEDDSGQKIKELIASIGKAENEIKRSSTRQYCIAIIEIPVVIILIIIAFFLKSKGYLFSDLDVMQLLYISISILIVSIIHTHFTLRFYQQSIKTSKELLEKRLGALYLNIAIDRQDLAGIIKFGIFMFLGHHGKATKPFDPEDNPLNNIGKIKRKNE